MTTADGMPKNVAYFWLTGGLSALLDNAPTYLVFFELAGGDAAKLMGELAGTLAAISMGAVYMGALTYIGNAPNFMIYAIATERGVKMPSFFGYIVWSATILLPVFLVLTFAFVTPWPCVALIGPLLATTLPLAACCGAAATAVLRAWRNGFRRHHGDRLDLDQRAGPGERGDRDRGARRRRRGVDEAVAHLAEHAEMGDVGEVVVELHDMGEIGADRGERVLEIDEGLLRLGAEVAGRADDLVVEVEAELAGNEDDAARHSARPHGCSRRALRSCRG